MLQSLATLMRRTGVTMHDACEERSSAFARCRDKSSGPSAERLAIEADLRHAMLTEALAVHYQPKVSALAGAIEGVEALVRWKHPRLGDIAPAKFIPVAEDMGLIVPLGSWVIRKAFEQLVEWRRQGLPEIRMSINVSSAQLFNPGLAADIDDLLAQTHIDPRLLEFEFTEGLLAQDAGRATEMLAALRALGVRLAIDDFGTGHASLPQLRGLQVDTVKIDRSIVRGVADDVDARVIAQAIIRVARGLRIDVVAKGVETDAQHRVLTDLGCDLLQGFLFSPSVSAGEVTAMLRRQMERGEVCGQYHASLTGLDVGFAPTMI
jgi:EAL domain-containing protein (putative c-di-GMP-specific phosphodiesterase class I)